MSKIISIEEAANVLIAAAEVHKEASVQNSIARNRECEALNKLNDAQRQFDKAVGELKGKVNVGDWKNNRPKGVI